MESTFSVFTFRASIYEPAVQAVGLIALRASSVCTRGSTSCPLNQQSAYMYLEPIVCFGLELAVEALIIRVSSQCSALGTRSVCPRLVPTIIVDALSACSSFPCSWSEQSVCILLCKHSLYMHLVSAVDLPVLGASNRCTCAWSQQTVYRRLELAFNILILQTRSRYTCPWSDQQFSLRMELTVRLPALRVSSRCNCTWSQ